jgi:hypothetical protein
MHESRHDVADTLSMASEAVKPAKTGLGRKIAMAATAYRLARRFPVAALIVGGIAVVYFLSRRRDGAPLAR